MKRNKLQFIDEDDDDDEGHADIDDDVNSLMKVAPLLLYICIVEQGEEEGGSALS